jgi:hypothetical protein
MASNFDPLERRGFAGCVIVVAAFESPAVVAGLDDVAVVGQAIEQRSLMAAFDPNEASPELMLACGGTIAPWLASVTFGGPDLKTVYVGNLRGTRILYFRSPVAELPMVHW